MVCSKFWKLDKIDKIVISLIFIVVSMFSVFNCFCFAESPVDGFVIEDYYIEGASGNIVYRDKGILMYYPLSFGHKYSLVNNSGHVISLGFTENIPELGDTAVRYGYLSASGTKKFLADDEYLVFSISSSNDLDNIFLYDETPGFSGVIGNLSLSVGISQIWSVFETSIPWVLVVVLFVFGWWFFAHWVKELGKGREF